MLHKAFGNEFSNDAIRFLQVNTAKVIAVLFGMVWNYMLYHLVVFRHPEDEEIVA
jgi:hypothetical protein